MKLKIPNTTLCKLIAHKRLEMIGAINGNTIYFIVNHNDRLENKHKFTDDNIHESLTCMDFLDWGNKVYCVTGGKLGIIKIIDIHTGLFHGYIAAHTGVITDVKIVGQYIITASEDCSIKMHDFKTFKCVRVFIGHTDVVLTLEINEYENKMISTGIDLKIMEWNLDLEIEECESKPIYITDNTSRSLLIQCLYHGLLLIALSADNRVLCVKPKYDDTPVYESEDISKYKQEGLYRDTDDYIIYKEAIYSKYETLEENNEILPNLLFIKELFFDNIKIKKIAVKEFNLMCLTESNGIIVIDLKRLLEDKNSYAIPEYDMTKSKDFALSSKYIYILYEDGSIKSIMINNYFN